MRRWQKYNTKKGLLQLRPNCYFILAFGILLFGLSTSGVYAEELSPEERGLEIARQAHECDSGYKDMGAELEMVLRTGSGQEAKRELRVRTLEVSDKESRALVVFYTPEDVRGTALLTHTFTDKEDDQWLYLPAVGRVKRIAGGGRSGPFMGSEFSFEDMGSQRVEKFTYKYLRDEPLNDMECHVLDRYPVDKNSGYSKQTAWLDKEHLRIHKVDYYDRRGDLLKTLVFTGYTLYKDKFWRPTTMEMKNHQNGKSTLLVWKNYSFDNGFSEREFDQNALRSAR